MAPQIVVITHHNKNNQFQDKNKKLEGDDKEYENFKNNNDNNLHRYLDKSQNKHNIQNNITTQNSPCMTKSVAGIESVIIIRIFVLFIHNNSNNSPLRP